MKVLHQAVTVFLLCSLLLFSVGCGVSEEKYKEAVDSADDYKTKYEHANLDFEKCSKELKAAKEELLGYEPYNELVNDLENKDYRAAIKRIYDMSSEDADLTDSYDETKNEDIETKYLGTWCKRQVLFLKKRHFIFPKCGKLFSSVCGILFSRIYGCSSI